MVFTIHKEYIHNTSAVHSGLKSEKKKYYLENASLSRRSEGKKFKKTLILGFEVIIVQPLRASMRVRIRISITLFFKLLILLWALTVPVYNFVEIKFRQYILLTS